MHNYVQKLLLFCFIAAFGNVYADNKIVILLSPPRSLSVAFFRMMDARGDFKVMHEPFICPFDKIHLPEETKDWFIPHAADTYEKVKDTIFEHSKTSHVFIKDMPFGFKDFIEQDELFLTDSRVHIVFLLRNPHHSVISMYWKMKGVFNDDIISRDLPRFINYEDMYFLFQKIIQSNPNRSLLIKTEDLYNNPEITVSNLCEYLDIPYIPESLSWNSLEGDFDIHEQWGESKHQHYVDLWHGDALRSTGFGKPRLYEVNENGNPTFVEISNAEHKDVCQQAYEVNKVYYEKLLQQYELLN